MLLSTLMQGVKIVDWQGADAEVTRICAHSDGCIGAVFVCLVGEHDAHDYIADALNNGAVALVTEHRVDAPVTQVIVTDTRAALSQMAAAYYGHPARGMKMIGVVGTNGKTTTAHMIREILEYSNLPTALIGTNGFSYNGTHRDYGMTTPDPLMWQAMLAEAKAAGCVAAVTEVSAHAIYYKKTFGTKMDITVFTNFSRDHLDFFRDMETYANTKSSFFAPQYTLRAVVNVDDLLGMEIALADNLVTLTYGIETPSDVFAIDYCDTAHGARFIVNLEDELYEVNLPMHGDYNMYNALAALSVGHMVGLKLGVMVEALENMEAVAGRYQTFDLHGVKVVVDYAHTPDGVAKILDSIGEWASGRVITVFGCGGNRDRDKRPQMARAAEMRSDYLVVTSDNPRFEDPNAIIAEICTGLSGQVHADIREDRGEAIRHAIDLAKPGDVVAVLGKGNENYLEVGGDKLKYCDLDVVRQVLGESV